MGGGGVMGLGSGFGSGGLGSCLPCPMTIAQGSGCASSSTFAGCIRLLSGVNG